MTRKKWVYIADERKSIQARTKDGLLEIQLFTNTLFDNGRLEIESHSDDNPKKISLQIENLNKIHVGSKECIYKITTYISTPNEKQPLPGAVYINNEGEYLGPDGRKIG